MTLSVAVIGAGPSGFYTVEALLKLGLDCQIDILESLPTPYGLIRFGVAPDHQSTKRVTRAYERTARDEHVGYFGNVEIGRDVSLDELRGLYDAVVLAIGAPLDRGLDVPGGDKPGVHGAAAFVGWYNGHPDFRDLAPDLNCEAIAIIGNGNVALDVARVLVKTPGEMAKTDMPEYAAAAIHGAPIRDVHLLGRRGPVEAKWTNVELREMGQLEDCQVIIDPEQLPERVEGDWSARDRRLREKNLETLRSFVGQPPDGKRKRLHFQFYAKPVEVLGEERVTGLRLERTRVEDGRVVETGETFDLDCGLVVAAIGYRALPIEGVPFDERRGIVSNKEGRVAPGLYVVGWAKRGPTGVIGSNKPDADLIASHIAADLAPEGKGGGKPPGDKEGRAGLQVLLAERRVAWVSFADWLAIEAAEIAAAPSGAPRQKLFRIKDMLAVLGKSAGQRRTG
ncbi:MAG: FAD-dependent oxidoreductase [Kiloniellales bacterium]